MPVTYLEAKEAGTLDDYEWGDGCDTDTGQAEGAVRVRGAVRARVRPRRQRRRHHERRDGRQGHDRALRAPSRSADLQSLIAGIGANDTPGRALADAPATTSRSRPSLSRDLRPHDRARRLPGDRAPATTSSRPRPTRRRSSQELKPFAVLGGPGLDRGTFAQEITSNGIVCIDCAGPIPADMADGMEPLVWSGLPRCRSVPADARRVERQLRGDARRRRERGVRRAPTRCATASARSA